MPCHSKCPARIQTLFRCVIDDRNPENGITIVIDILFHIDVNDLRRRKLMRGSVPDHLTEIGHARAPYIMTAP